MTTPRLALPELLQDTKSGYVTFNDLGRILDAVFVTAVQHYVLVDPPAGPTEGQCWYVPVSATGAWAGQDKDIAHWFNGMWYFHTPQPGMSVYLVSEGAPAYIDENGDVVLVGPPVYEYQNLVLSDSPLAYYPLNERTGTVVEDVAGSADGTLSGIVNIGVAPLVQEGTAYDMDTNKIVAAIGASGDTWTFECWIKPDVLVNDYQALANQSLETGLGIYLYSDRLAFYLGGNYYSDTTIVVGTRYHVVFSVDAGAGTWYLNGVPDGTVAGVPEFNPVAFGANIGDVQYYNGVYDQIAFYQTALTAQQVLNHYVAGNP